MLGPRVAKRLPHSPDHQDASEDPLEAGNRIAKWWRIESLHDQGGSPGGAEVARASEDRDRGSQRAVRGVDGQAKAGGGRAADVSEDGGCKRKRTPAPDSLRVSANVRGGRSATWYHPVTNSSVRGTSHFTCSVRKLCVVLCFRDRSDLKRWVHQGKGGEITHVGRSCIDGAVLAVLLGDAVNTSYPRFVHFLLEW